MPKQPRTSARHTGTNLLAILAREFLIEFDQAAGVYYLNGEAQEKSEELGKLLAVLYRHAKTKQPNQKTRRAAGGNG